MMSAFDDKEDEDFYADNYYDYRSLLRSRNNPRSDNFTAKVIGDENLVSIFRITLTMLLRVGFLLVQIGSVPVSNVNLILLQNIVDFCIVTTVSILVGFIVAFTGDIAGVIGEGVWIGEGKANLDEALVGWGAAVTASAICTCCIVGRMHAAGYLLSGIIISGIVQPLVVHWAWTPRGWMADNILRGRSVSFKDHAGGGTIHAVGGLAGFLGCATLGRRILRLRDIDDASLSAGSPGVTIAGYFFIMLGLQGFGMPIAAAQRETHNPMSKIIANNLLAGSSSSLLIVALHFALSREPFNHWTVMRCVQGSISGIVATASGIDVCSPLATIGIGCSNGLLFYLVSRRVYRSALEDYCNIVAAHLTSALFGTFLAPLCTLGMKSDSVNRATVLDVAWQAICILALLLLVTATMGPLFALLDSCGFLRNRSEFANHLRATLALERGPPRSYMQRLFFPGVDSLYLQPGSIAKIDKGPQVMSPRLWRYQQELTRLEEARSAGGNTVSETAEEVVDPSRENHPPQKPSDILSQQRLKKPRQIHTLPKIIYSEDLYDPEESGDKTKTVAVINEDHFYAGEGETSVKNLAADTGCRLMGEELSVTLHSTNEGGDFHGDEKVLVKDFDVDIVPKLRDDESSYDVSGDFEEDKIVEEFTVV